MPYADLHVHTTRSDGTLALEDVPRAATDAGVSVVALTDHDRTQPLEAPLVEREGVTLVHGIELRVDAGDVRLDLLGYGLEPTPALEACLRDLQRDRRERAKAIVELVEDHCGVSLECPISDGVGRPHIATAIAEHPGIDYGYQGAFDHLIGSDGPCYVSRSIPDLERGRRLLEESATLVSLAHPLRYPDTAKALSVAVDLGAVELHYPYGGDPDTTAIERAVADHGLLITGGSDAHGETLGEAGLTRAEYERLGVATGRR